jgi:uncharacterized protein YicC (UPF0701 family)
MIASMTGFARRELAGSWGTLTCELRSVNHRYLEPGFRLPEELRPLESDLRQLLTRNLKRGKVDCTIHLRGSLTAERDLRIDAAALGRVAAREGKRLGELIEQRCANLGALVTQVRARLPEIQARVRNRLNERVAELAASVDRDRIEQEVVLQLQRVDVAEELDRIGGHIEETRRVMGGGEAAGRRLDFLMQELNREANTLASKSQDLDTTRLTVDMKVLIEQMREQVQNIE